MAYTTDIGSAGFFFEGRKSLFMFKRSYFRSATFAELTTIEKRLIPFLESRTDLNGQILTTVDEIRKENIMTAALIPAALERLEQHGYIYKDGASYFSNFHHQPSPDETGFNYINVYKFFSDEKFKKQHKLYYNLFYYFFSNRPLKLEQFHYFNIEQMYENKLNNGKIEFKGFQNYNHFTDCLSSMVANGHIEVKFGGNTYSNPGGNKASTYFKYVKGKLYSYCTRDPRAKKKTRIMKGEKHLIGARVLPALVQKDQQEDVYARRITLKDLATVAFEYGYNLADYSIGLLSKIHTYKLKLYQRFGNAGIEMYHDSLKEYFYDRGYYAFESDVQDKEFINNLDKFYVLPKIKLSIESYFEKVTSKAAAKTEGLLQKLESLASHVMTDYPDQLSAFVLKLKQTNEGLLKYALEKSVIWNKLNIKANEHQHAVSEDYSEPDSQGWERKLSEHPMQTFKNILGT